MFSMLGEAALPRCSSKSAGKVAREHKELADAAAADSA
jgi:hypothetical protein